MLIRCHRYLCLVAGAGENFVIGRDNATSKVRGLTWV